MTLSRRDFMRAGTAAALAAAVPGSLLRRWEPRSSELAPIVDPMVKALAVRALDAAHTAGASYADVRLTHRSERRADRLNVHDDEELTVGVRALVDGSWGFASSTFWTHDELARLGREAVAQARTTAIGNASRVELAAVPAVIDRHWAMPVAIDPFTIPVPEALDVVAGIEAWVRTMPGVGLTLICYLTKEERAFASTEGSYCTQTVYLTEGLARIVYTDGTHGEVAFDDIALVPPVVPRESQIGWFDLLPAAGRGWEYVRDFSYRDVVAHYVEEMREAYRLPTKPVEVGRYDVIVDARTAAVLLAGTLAPATELDRALGYEANASGTSYLNNPLAMLGTEQVGAPALTVTANRSAAGGAATVQWDEEGVAPEAFTIVKDGVLADFPTTRESAAWLEPSYQKEGRPVHSHGCAAAPSAGDASMQHTPNLVLRPGAQALDFDGLVAEMTDGLAVRRLAIDMDFQALNGLGRPDRLYQVKRGKRVALIEGAGLLFRAPELWKGLQALGGAGSVEHLAGASTKGEPAQTTRYTIDAVPALFKQLTLIDVQRKA
jgi:TldD protein